ncbi:LysR family transcriptional regulator [Shimia biformata]|uniref:LysR family transcriptional regulator n=1 Tax=Shimia biformata TaxID=1294299 RepID=UPI001950946B|nr:LysR family transcriptional regulator [Shimia biformata]
MELPKTPFDWNHVRAFLATAEEGTLSAAARRLGLTQPTLGRQVAALEDDLGVLLFERVGKALHLTRAGRDILEHVRDMGDAATRLSIAAAGQSQSIDGLVRITASDIYSTHILPPILKDLQKRAPKLEIEIVAVNDIQDLMRREADIALRHVRPEQPDLIARLVREATARFYASTDYIQRNGRPETLADLARHEFVSFGDTDEMLKHLLPLGAPLTADNFRIGSKNGIVAWNLARQGFGISIMDDVVAAQCPEVEVLLPDMAPVVFPVWLTTHRELHTSRRIRVVFDLLADALTAPKKQG